jgi:hypothetical protein
MILLSITTRLGSRHLVRVLESELTEVVKALEGHGNLVAVEGE